MMDNIKNKILNFETKLLTLTVKKYEIYVSI